MDILRSFSNLFNKKKDEAQPHTHLKITHSRLREWVEQKREKELGEILEESTPLITEILSIKANIIDIMKELKERTFPEEMEKRMYKPVKTSKPALINGMLNALGAIKEKEAPWKFEDIEAFHEKIEGVMKNIHRLQNAHGKFVAIVFREEMLKLGSELNALIDLTGRLEEVLDDGRKNMGLITILSEKDHQIQSRLEELGEAKKKEGQLGKRRDAVKSSIRRLKREADAVKKTPEFKEYAELREILRGIREAKKRLETSMLNELGFFKKALKKLIKLSDDGTCQLASCDIAKGYLEQPLETYLLHDKDSAELDSILRTIEECTKSGHIKLKKKEEERLSFRIGRVSEGSLKKIREEYDKLATEESSLLKDIRSIKPGEMELEKQLHENEMELEPIEKEKEELTSAMGNMEKSIADLKAEVESTISELEGVEVEFSI